MKKVLFAGIACIVMGISLHSRSQSLSVNTDGSTADASALLDVKSTTKGVLIPRMSKAERNAIASPATGLLVFQSGPDSIGFHYYYGGSWLWLLNAVRIDSTYWNTHGNTGLDTSSYLGHTGNVPIIFKSNGQRVGKLSPSSGNYYIGKGAGTTSVFEGIGNIAIGDSAGSKVNDIFPNVLIGYKAGKESNAASNVMIGGYTGQNTTSGMNNTFLGYGTAFSNTFGGANTFVGHSSGFSNIDGNGNTLIGYGANVGSGSLINATAIGYGAVASQSNSLVLGSTGANVVNVGINETTPNARLHIRRNGSSGGVFFSTASLIVEDNTTSYVQLSNPNANETGILSGNAETTIRSAVIFRADSSLWLRSGGNNNRLAIDNTGLVGVRTTAPQSYLDVNGSTGNAISVSTASQVLDEFDHTHVISSGAGAITITLPAASTCSRREYVIVNQSGSAKTITSYLDFTGAANTTAPANNSITLQSNGASWYRIR